ncbi:MAG: hypothetical protein BMS9Abin05_2117 [Rhodothermia bacterium]|nr:MAG: hypothetical protein BMS9Abin05_2117 [Rhodothermia bacterium]
MTVNFGKSLSFMWRVVALAILIIIPAIGRTLPLPLDIPLPGINGYS